MRIVDIIEKKRDGGELTREEIEELILGYVKEQVPDYQVAAFLMAVVFRGMTDRETAILTDVMMHSGDTVDLSPLAGIKVDKHSTGGVGDTTTLIVAPLVAACGGTVAKMSGRGLGHTGGTIDKLESIAGYRTELPFEEFAGIVNKTGFSIISQSGTLCPADKKIYALRNATGTVDSIPLICASTTCLFSSSTRNIAFGSFSETVPSNSITSALDIQPPNLQCVFRLPSRRGKATGSPVRRR